MCACVCMGLVGGRVRGLAGLCAFAYVCVCVCMCVYMCVSRFVDGQLFEQKVNHSAYVILPDCCSAQLATRLKYDLRVLGVRDIIPDTHFILFLFYYFGIFVIMAYFGGVDLLLFKSILVFLCMCHYVGITSQTTMYIRTFF